MKAIYRGKLHHIDADSGNGVVLDDGSEVSFGDHELIIDPTDDQVAAAIAGEPIPADPDDIANFGQFIDELPDDAVPPAVKDQVKSSYSAEWPRKAS